MQLFALLCWEYFCYVRFLEAAAIKVSKVAKRYTDTPNFGLESSLSRKHEITRCQQKPPDTPASAQNMCALKHLTCILPLRNPHIRTMMACLCAWGMSSPSFSFVLLMKLPSESFPQHLTFDTLQCSAFSSPCVFGASTEASIISLSSNHLELHPLQCRVCTNTMPPPRNVDIFQTEQCLAWLWFFLKCLCNKNAGRVYDIQQFALKM